MRSHEHEVQTEGQNRDEKQGDERDQHQAGKCESQKPALHARASAKPPDGQDDDACDRESCSH
jgi:hypothetical protein